MKSLIIIIIEYCSFVYMNDEFFIEDFYCVLAIIGYSMMDGVIIDSVDKFYDNVIHNRYIWWEVKSSKPFIVFLQSCEIPSVVDKSILIDLGKRMVTAYRYSFLKLSNCQ